MKKLLSTLLIASAIATSVPIAIAEESSGTDKDAYIAPLDRNQPITLTIQLDGNNPYDQKPLKVDNRHIVVTKVKDVKNIDELTYHQLKLMKNDIKNLTIIKATTVTTDGSGRATLTNLDPGIYKLSEKTDDKALRLSEDVFILPVKTSSGNFGYHVTVHPKSIVAKPTPVPQPGGSSDIPAWAILIPLIPIGIGLIPQANTLSDNPVTHPPTPNVVKQPAPVVKKRGPILLAHTGANIIYTSIISILMMLAGGIMLMKRQRKTTGRKTA